VRVLVTGGAGFVGSHVVERLCRDGHDVRVLDDFSTGFRRNLRGVESDVDVVEGDVRDPGTVRAAVAGSEVVLHQAALPSVPRSIRAPLESHAVNALGTLNVLMAAREAQVRRVVYASSSSVYGDSSVLPEHEGLAPAPRSPYAVSKLAGEHYCRVFWDVHGLETVSLRYFNVFGPRQDRRSQYAGAIAAFSAAMLNGARPVVFGDGRQSRDFTYVDNAVDANIRAMDAPGAAGGTYNVACGERVSLLGVLRELERLTGRTADPAFEPVRAGDVRHTHADIERARAALGYRPVVDFAEGLSRALGHYERELAAEPASA